ncbi:hypothetical protein [Amycolatopsis sp. EV170708-02-1]|uniref:hypothetical protein n=1 Tax=Amycolatopsis sp. EV170708-02-1 TaxID=2919322 RepID=UPI001F0BAB3C|nr:hypothetical protein [Amycolatopsis sp. EV170708-02-1]UMP00650.1 hypothetical protein MJQ72_29775 [Amycolatopsis sp. EV170708-02-1]
MDELENRLRGITLAEPPLGFDPDEVAATAAKKARNRRGVVATGIATLAVIAAAVVFVAPWGGTAPVSPAATTSALPPQIRPDGNTPRMDLTPQKVRNLEHLKKAVTALLPGATELTFGGFEQSYPDEWDLMTASVRYRDASKTERGFNVTLTGVVSTRNGYSDRAACPEVKVTLPDGKPLRCEVLPRPGGARVVINEKGDPGANLKGTTVESVSGRDAIAFLADGTAVTVTDLGALNGRGGPSLTDQQLLALVLDPELTLR